MNRARQPQLSSPRNGTRGKLAPVDEQRAFLKCSKPESISVSSSGHIIRESCICYTFHQIQIFPHPHKHTCQEESLQAIGIRVSSVSVGRMVRLVGRQAGRRKWNMTAMRRRHSEKVPDPSTTGSAARTGSSKLSVKWISISQSLESD